MQQQQCTCGSTGLNIVRPWSGLPWTWSDAAARQNSQFIPSRSAARAYERQLRGVAGQVRHMIATSSSDGAMMQRRLRQYAQIITPWAEQTAANMTQAVARKNDQVWRIMASKMSDTLRRQMTHAFNGVSLHELIRYNVNLIKSIPIDVADNIAALTEESLIKGLRAEEMAAKIMGQGDIAEFRARTIARTEISKANTELTRMRSQAVGSVGYIWRTAEDGDVREDHQKMEGVFVNWNEPPLFGNYSCHAGEAVNCRCYPEPAIALH